MTENEVWEKCRLFSGLDQEARKRAAAFFRAEREAAARGAVLHAAGSVLPRFGLVLSGRVQVFLDDINGLRILMASVGPGVTPPPGRPLAGGRRAHGAHRLRGVRHAQGADGARGAPRSPRASPAVRGATA